MAITNPLPTPAMPSKLRVISIMLHSGIAFTSDRLTYGYSVYPGAEIIAQPCDQMLDVMGSPMLNEYGLPLYEDKGTAISIRISDPAKLLPFLSVWGGLIDAAEAEIASIYSEGE